MAKKSVFHTVKKLINTDVKDKSWFYWFRLKWSILVEMHHLQICSTNDGELIQWRVNFYFDEEYNVQGGKLCKKKLKAVSIVGRTSCDFSYSYSHNHKEYPFVLKLDTMTILYQDQPYHKIRL